jgi:hypothetical protein
MESRTTPKCLFNELFGVRRRGRPRKKWFQDLKDDLKRMRIGKWKRKAQEQNTWRLTVEEADASPRAVALRKKQKKKNR